MWTRDRRGREMDMGVVPVRFWLVPGCGVCFVSEDVHYTNPHTAGQTVISEAISTEHSSMLIL